MTNASKRLLYINDSPHHPEAFCGRVRCKFIKNKFGEDKNDSYSLKDMRFWLFFFPLSDKSALQCPSDGLNGKLSISSRKVALNEEKPGRRASAFMFFQILLREMMLYYFRL